MNQQNVSPCKDIYKPKKDLKSIQINTSLDSVNNLQISKDFLFGLWETWKSSFCPSNK